MESVPSSQQSVAVATPADNGECLVPPGQEPPELAEAEGPSGRAARQS